MFTSLAAEEMFESEQLKEMLLMSLFTNERITSTKCGKWKGNPVML